jgi:hypothetical protein
VSGGESHTCGATSSNQTYCWGWNRFGQIGDSGNTGVRTRPSLVKGGHAFVQVNVAFQHSCGVTTANKAYCWGYGKLRQIGDGGTSNRVVPRAVAGGFSFHHMSGGSGFTCAQTTLNRVYCWGDTDSVSSAMVRSAGTSRPSQWSAGSSSPSSASAAGTPAAGLPKRSPIAGAETVSASWATAGRRISPGQCW